MTKADCAAALARAEKSRIGGDSADLLEFIRAARGDVLALCDELERVMAKLVRREDVQKLIREWEGRK